jgi:hypothetical protein
LIPYQQKGNFDVVCAVAWESRREGVNVLEVFFLLVTGMFCAGCLADIVGCEQR